MTEKFCGHCKRTLPIEAFGSNASRKDGINRVCRECVVALAKEAFDAEMRNRAFVEEMRDAGGAWELYMQSPQYRKHMAGRS